MSFCTFLGIFHFLCVFAILQIFKISLKKSHTDWDKFDDFHAFAILDVL